jgi:hypothetical protein
MATMLTNVQVFESILLAKFKSEPFYDFVEAGLYELYNTGDTKQCLNFLRLFCNLGLLANMRPGSVTPSAFRDCVNPSAQSGERDYFIRRYWMDLRNVLSAISLSSKAYSKGPQLRISKIRRVSPTHVIFAIIANLI